MSLADVLQSIGKGIARVPRLIGGELYDYQPIISGSAAGMQGPYAIDDPSLLAQPTDDSGNPTDESGLAPDSPAPIAPFPPMSQYRVVGEQRGALKPEARRILDSLPGALMAGAAAGGTPNIARGGGTDVMRALSTGLEFPKMQQQQAQDRALATAKTQAAISKEAADTAEAQSRSGLYAAQTKVALAPPPKDIVVETKKGLRGIWDTVGQKWVVPPPEEGAATIKINPDVAKRAGLVVPDEATSVDVSVDAWNKMLPNLTKPEVTPKPTLTETVDERRKEGIAQGLAGDRLREYSLTGNIRAVPREPGTKVGTPGQFGMVERTKSSRLLAAERAEKSGAVSPEELRDTKQQIQDAYEAQIEALGGTAEHYEYPPAPAQEAAPVTSHPADTGLWAKIKGIVEKAPPAPSAPAAMAGSASKTVLIRKPDGTLVNIPRENRDAAVRLGGQVVNQ